MCVSTEREYRKGALSGKTLLEFVFVRVTCDVTEKIRKKISFKKQRERSFVLRFVVAKKEGKKKCFGVCPPSSENISSSELKFGCFEEFFERCSYR